MHGSPALLLALLFVSLGQACRHRGKTYQNNEQWIVNGSLIEGDHEWLCQINVDGHVSLRQEINKNAKCEGKYPTGASWNRKGFEFQCAEGGVTVFVGCRSSAGTLIQVNSSQDFGPVTFFCLRFPNGTIALHSRTREKNCVDGRGNTHAVGETWIEDKVFVRECLDHGNATVIKCQHDGIDIGINREVVKDQLVYHCEYKDNVFKFFTTSVEKEKSEREREKKRN